jgi:hypothetical protein
VTRVDRPPNTPRWSYLRRVDVSRRCQRISRADTDAGVVTPLGRVQHSKCERSDGRCQRPIEEQLDDPVSIGWFSVQLTSAPFPGQR